MNNTMVSDGGNIEDGLKELRSSVSDFVYNKWDLCCNNNIRYLFVVAYAKIDYRYDLQGKFYSHLYLFDRKTKQLSILQKNCPFPIPWMCWSNDKADGRFMTYNYCEKKLYLFRQCNKRNNYLDGPWILNIDIQKY